MTNLINQITINGETTTFLNYINSFEPGSPSGAFNYDYSPFLLAHWGNNRQRWTRNGQHWGVRFPVAWETLTGNIAADAGNTSPGTNARTSFNVDSDYVNANTSNNTVWTGKNHAVLRNIGTFSGMTYACINNQSFVIAKSSSTTTRTIAGFRYCGWLKDRQYTGSVFPRGFVLLVANGSGINFVRGTIENGTGQSNLTIQNPALSCSIATPGANSTDVVVRDSATGNYLGSLWNMMILPSSAIAGKIYKNTGIDPDTGSVETDQKAFWMCVGSWGTDKIGMRVWTEGIN